MNGLAPCHKQALLGDASVANTRWWTRHVLQQAVGERENKERTGVRRISFTLSRQHIRFPIENQSIEFTRERRVYKSWTLCPNRSMDRGRSGGSYRNVRCTWPCWLAGSDDPKWRKWICAVRRGGRKREEKRMKKIELKGILQTSQFDLLLGRSPSCGWVRVMWLRIYPVARICPVGSSRRTTAPLCRPFRRL